MVCQCNSTGNKCGHHAEEPKKRIFPNNEKYPIFLPQPADEFASSSVNEESEGKIIGPWAGGRVSWNASGGITGIRSIVDRYSITRYSPKDWRKRNLEVLDKTFATSQLKCDVRCTLDSIVEGADKHQKDNTERLQERLKEVRDCKNEIENLVKDFREEIVLMTETKIKLKFLLPTLKMPESIAGECIDRRASRMDPDLVKDEVEIELVKELSMIRNARDAYVQMIKDVEKQIQVHKSIKDELEMTWSDKKETCEFDSVNACLKSTTPIIEYHGGAERLPANQSTVESWAIFNATLINTAKAELSKSRQLRESAENLLVRDTVRELREQADKVQGALVKRIRETDLCRQTFENELQDVLRQISEAESLYEAPVKLQQQLEYNTKLVQTRLHNRLKRPKVENCRDEPEYGLLEEAKYLRESKTNLKNRIEDIDKTLSKLYETRSNLEYVILTKRKSLYIDEKRCMAYRERYPDAVALGGGGGDR